MTAGAVDRVLARPPRQSEHVFAMRALAIDVGLAVPPFVAHKTKRLCQLALNAAVNGIFLLPTVKIFGKRPKQGVAQQYRLYGNEYDGMEKYIYHRQRHAQYHSPAAQPVVTVAAVHKARHTVDKGHFLIISHLNSSNV